MEPPQSIPLAFSKIPTKPMIIRFSCDKVKIPSGGHIQGIQGFDRYHLVISGSSDSKAYFFIVKWKGIINSNEVGKVIKLVKINDDFPEMKHNHASGIQLTDRILAIGTEGGGDPIKSSIIFYDLSDLTSPKVVGPRIDRNQDTAGAVGIVKRSTDYLLAVGGWDSNIVDFYVSNNSDITTRCCDFSKVKTWRDRNKDTSGWIDKNWGKYQALNLLRGSNGELFLVGFNRDFGGHDWADLYTINMKTSTSRMLKKIDNKRILCKYEASFRYGGGWFAPQPSMRITLLATERNIQQFTVINCF